FRGVTGPAPLRAHPPLDDHQSRESRSPDAAGSRRIHGYSAKWRPTGHQPHLRGAVAINSQVIELLGRRDLDSEGRSEELGLASSGFIRDGHRHGQAIRPDGNSFGQPVLHDHGLAWLQEAERNGTFMTRVRKRHPGVSVFPLQRSFAEVVRIEESNLTEVRYRDVDRLAREVSILGHDGGHAFSWARIVGSQGETPRSGQCDRSDNAQIYLAQG